MIQMKNKIINPFLYNLPTLDLHGMDRIYAKYKTNEFIFENLKLGNKKIIIVHGIGEGILKRSVHEQLKINKNVKDFYLDGMNIGQTIVILK